MLFNSYQFIFVFLPLALIGYQIAGLFHRRAVVAWLAFASLAFYAYWRPELLYILVISVVLNYGAGALIGGRIATGIRPRTWLILAIVLDLSALCYFKYLFPSLNFLASAAGSSTHWGDVILPLGISFFTFTQIAFLIDLHQGGATHQDFGSYLLFVTFFPHLIAGPILHHAEMMPQFQRQRRYRLDLSDLAVGFSWFIMGLGKKVILADNLARIANPAFDAPVLSTSTAWVGALSYTLQLYFDFSGYSDMALGLARMFSIDFPLNFNSPLKAASIIDFWRRWHMTLSRYIRTYLYSPIKAWATSIRAKSGKDVSREAVRRPGAFALMIAFPMITTMFIAGVWHGAGFQFIIFGLLHGIYLTINHAWRVMRRTRGGSPVRVGMIGTAHHGASVLLTFLCVVVGFVFFRASSAGRAVSILAAMSGLHQSDVAPASRASGLVVAFAFVIVWFLPNTQQILSRFKPSLDESAWHPESIWRKLLWAPDVGWALALGAVFFGVLAEIQNPSTFLYFQF